MVKWNNTVKKLEGNLKVPILFLALRFLPQSMAVFLLLSSLFCTGPRLGDGFADDCRHSAGTSEPTKRCDGAHELSAFFLVYSELGNAGAPSASPCPPSSLFPKLLQPRLPVVLRWKPSWPWQGCDTLCGPALLTSLALSLVSYPQAPFAETSASELYKGTILSPPSHRMCRSLFLKQIFLLPTTFLLLLILRSGPQEPLSESRWDVPLLNPLLYPHKTHFETSVTRSCNCLFYIHPVTRSPLS